MSVSSEKKPAESAVRSTAVSFHCAFCGRDNRSVGKMIAGPGVAICSGCVEDCARICGLACQPTSPDSLESGSTSAEAEGTPAPFGAWTKLDGPTLLTAIDSTERMLKSIRTVHRDQVNVLRARGTSWAVIGEALGISRQGAWERFADEHR